MLSKVIVISYKHLIFNIKKVERKDFEGCKDICFLFLSKPQ